MAKIPDTVARAAGSGPLRLLASPKQIALISEGQLSRFPAGTLIYTADDKPPFVGLIVEGFLRVFVAASSGRESTIRYARPGDLLGVVAALSGPSATGVQTLADTLVWKVNIEHLKRLSRSDAEVAMFLARECAERAAALVNEISGSAFATIRQRIAHHLLSMAHSRTTQPFLVAEITQMDLANAVGTVREVAVRELRSLREQGLVRPERGGIAILDAAKLDQLAAAAFRAGKGTKVPDNSGNQA